MLGIIEEQHPDRTRLFMQWKKMEWPILIDSLNLLQAKVVPRTLLIDEYGVIQSNRARPADLAEFLATRFDPPTGPNVESEARNSAQTELARLDRLFLSRDAARLDEIVHGYSSLLSSEPEDGAVHFRLGVAYRARYDSDERAQGDFPRAVEHWKKALEIDPNQYIWRRRIQQYGPRLDKPYPFYYWVEQARKEIAARGEKPATLLIEPAGAELAQPSREFVAGETTEEPDPQGRIDRDDGLIRVETLLVPDTSGQRRAGRVHLTFTPDASRKAHWNNEVDDMVVWISPPAGWEVDRQHLTAPSPPEALSMEERRLEFEVRGPQSGPIWLQGYALYFVCEDVDGTCLYRRQDFRIEIE